MRVPAARAPQTRMNPMGRNRCRTHHEQRDPRNRLTGADEGAKFVGIWFVWTGQTVAEISRFLELKLAPAPYRCWALAPACHAGILGDHPAMRKNSGRARIVSVSHCRHKSLPKNHAKSCQARQVDILDMVGVVGSSPIAPTKFGREIRHLAATLGAFFLRRSPSILPVFQSSSIARGAGVAVRAGRGT